jgi:hypothetical protein
MKLSSNAQSAIQTNLSVSLVLPTSQQETAPVEIKIQPLQRGPVQVAHAPPMTSLAPPDDFLGNPIIYILSVAAITLHGKQAFF